jgi:hypothetical protein
MSYSKWFVIAIVVLGACAPEQLETGTVRAAIGGGTSTHIKVNGKAVDVGLNATNMNGFLNASKDQIADTSALDFGYAVHDPNPDIQTFVNGSGSIPNSALTIGASSATLNVTTTFPINQCVVNSATGETTCSAHAAIAINLTWTADGFQTIFQKLHQITVQGATTTTFKGTFDQISAGISGTFNGFTITDNGGNIIDTKNTTVTRDVDFEP